MHISKIESVEKLSNPIDQDGEGSDGRRLRTARRMMIGLSRNGARRLGSPDKTPNFRLCPLPIVDLRFSDTVHCSYTGLLVIPEFAHIPDREFQSRAEPTHSMFCIRSAYSVGYTGFPCIPDSTNLTSSDQSGIRAIDLYMRNEPRPYLNGNGHPGADRR